MSGKMHPIQPFFVGNTTRYYKKVIPDTPYVHFYTYTADAVSLPSSTVVPSGCAEMLFTFHEGRAEGHLHGLVTKGDVLEFQPGARYLGVRFRPGYLPGCLGVSLPELVNARVSLGDLPKCAPLIERMAEAGDFLERVELLRGFIGERWHSHLLLRQLMDLVEAQDGTVRVQELEERSLYSARYIRKVFDDNIGLSPKAFARCVRFQRLIGTMNSADCPSLSDLAADFGYFDQAHFSRDFKELTSVTPREYFGVVDVERYGQKFVYM